MRKGREEEDERRWREHGEERKIFSPFTRVDERGGDHARVREFHHEREREKGDMRREEKKRRRGCRSKESERKRWGKKRRRRKRINREKMMKKRDG